MSTMQMQLLQSVEGLNDTQIQSVLEIINSFKKALDIENSSGIQFEKKKGGKRELGILKGKTLIAEDYDFDESNDEIARMFGVIK